MKSIAVSVTLYYCCITHVCYACITTLGTLIILCAYLNTKTNDYTHAYFDLMHNDLILNFILINGRRTHAIVMRKVTK